MSRAGRVQWNGVWVTFCCLFIFAFRADAYELSIKVPVLEPAVAVSGANYVLLPDSPGTMTVTITVLCTLDKFLESPPASLDLTYRLLRGSATVAEVQQTPATPSYRWSTTATYERTIEISYAFPLPAAGTGDEELKTSSGYQFEVSIWADDTLKPDDTRASANFAYTVYSGRLIFNKVVTGLTSLVPATGCIGGDITLSTSSTAVWNAGGDVFSFDAAGLCASLSGNRDRYSSDLLVVSGSVEGIGPVQGTAAGLDWTIESISLDAAGGSFSGAAIALPDNVTCHAYLLQRAWPMGMTSIALAQGGSFTSGLDSAVLSLGNPVLFHPRDLPFYVYAQDVSFALDDTNTQGMVLSAPAPYYVHKDASDSLASGHPRKSFGFPSNDAMFRQALSSADNEITIDQYGVQGHLGFDGTASVMAFPMARLDHPAYEINLVNSRLADQSALAGTTAVSLTAGFDGNCPDGACNGLLAANSFKVSSPAGARFLANGGLAGRFDNLGDAQDPESSQLEWGGSNGTDATFFREDAGIPGVWMVPGFIMPQTAATPSVQSDIRITQTLLGSVTFGAAPAQGEPLGEGTLHLLSDPADLSARQGDGYFAGINMGPEFLIGEDPLTPVISPGAGALLAGTLDVRFNGNTEFAVMPDRDAVKYVLRPGGLTGVFNTAFSGSSAGDISIYGYGINFSRFSFRQTLNRLSPETFIDGELTLPAPVGGDNGLRVGFTRLALTCNGNLSSGTLDNEPEPDWPNGDEPTGCDGVNGDGDAYADESCHVLGYWNMPVLVTGMAFENDPEGPAASNDCNSLPRVLTLDTRNVVDHLDSILTLSAVYTPDGLIRNQTAACDTDTVLDQPSGGAKPGFSVRVSDIYLNEITDPAALPDWQGFTVISGKVDVPLFNDAPIKGHLINTSTASTQSVYVMADGEDLDRDGIPDGDAVTGSVDEFRELLAPSGPDAAPKPLFEYHWPGPGIIDLTYRADFYQSGAETMPRFKGVKRTTDLAGVLSIESVPDYINPERTKFSFGVSADTQALANLSIDVGGITDGLNDFFSSELGVSFDIESMLAQLADAQQVMHDITGADVSDILARVIDEIVDSTDLADAIRAAANGLSQAHQAPAMVYAVLSEPFETLMDEIMALADDPDLDLSALYIDVSVADELSGALAPFLRYDHTGLRDLYENYSGEIGDPAFDALLAKFQALQDILLTITDKLSYAQEATDAAADFLSDGTGAALTYLDTVIDFAYTASDLVHDLYDEATSGLGGFVTTGQSNPLLARLLEAKDGIRQVNTAIQTVHLGDIANALFLASVVAGSPMDVSMLHAAEETALTAVSQLNETITQAEENLILLLEGLPMADVLATIDGFIGDDGLIQTALRGASYPDTPAEGGLIHSLEAIKTDLPQYVDLMDQDLERLSLLVQALVPGDAQVVDVATWQEAVELSQAQLNQLITSLVTQITQTGEGAEGMIFQELAQIYEAANVDSLGFTAVWADPGVRKRILVAPLLFIVEGAGTIQQDIKDMVETVTGLLPNPSEEDIRAMLRATILNTEPVEEMNRIFYEQFGFVSDMVDDVTTQMALQINTMIRDAMASINEALQAQLEAVTADIGSGWGVSSAGIDGYAIVSQDEIERIHLEAAFTFDGEPDPTSFNAALDITAWNTENGPSGCMDGGSGKVDVVLSTHDVTADMLGMDVGLKEALLGFTLQTDPVLPLGIFGRVYLQGELGFESIALYDLGFEAAFGSQERYFAAKGAARFSDYTIPMAAFYLGVSCFENNVLERLDPEVAEFIGEINPMSGVYVRGSVEVPVWNNGCALTLGVGADIGAWFFTEPGSGTYGGLLGGSAYGELGCLASLKGAVSLIGQKSGATYAFSGSGWGAAGVGWCSQGKWKSVRDARKDDWCLTGEATFEVTYENNDWVFDGPHVSCCH